jgi:hypothetical protein
MISSRSPEKWTTSLRRPHDGRPDAQPHKPGTIRSRRYAGLPRTLRQPPQHTNSRRHHRPLSFSSSFCSSPSGRGRDPPRSGGKVREHASQPPLRAHNLNTTPPARAANVSSINFGFLWIKVRQRLLLPAIDRSRLHRIGLHLEHAQNNGLYNGGISI